MLGKLLGQSPVRPVIFGRNQQPAGIFVNTVNNARTFHPSHSGQIIPAMVKQSIHQSAAESPRRRMNSHPRRLVDHNQVFVFIDHFQRNIFRLRLGGFRRRNFNLITVAGTNFIGIVCQHVVIAADHALLNQPLHLRAGNIGNRQRQKLIQPQSFMFGTGLGSKNNVAVVLLHFSNKKFTSSGI